MYVSLPNFKTYTIQMLCSYFDFALINSLSAFLVNISHIKHITEKKSIFRATASLRTGELIMSRKKK